MADLTFRHPVGSDFRSLAASWPIRGIRVDNPTASWLRVTGIANADIAVPPYTLAWQRPISPAALHVDVLFDNSPSGTPSDPTIGKPVTVTIYDSDVLASNGLASGAEEIQTAGIGDRQYRFDGFSLTETVAAAAITLAPPAGTKFALLRWRVIAPASAESIIHSQITISMIDGAGADLFPPILLTPEHPASDFQTPTGRELAINQTVDIGGIVAPGGGRIALNSYLEFYAVT